MSNTKLDTIGWLKEMIRDLPDDMKVLTYHEEVDSENGTPIYQLEIDEQNNTFTIY